MGFGPVRWDTALNTSHILCNKHELAGIRRRDNHELLHANGGIDGTELYFCGNRNGGLAAAYPCFHMQTEDTIGNFWVDMTRSLLYVLLPLSIILAILLVSQGVVQTSNPYVRAQTLKALNRLLPSDRRPLRSPSSSSVPTAAVFSTPIPPILSKTRHRSPIFGTPRYPSHTCGVAFYFRKNGQ